MTHSDSEYDFPREEFKWPKEWLDAINSIKRTSMFIPGTIDILNALSKVGALKDPPQPRVIFFCPVCKVVVEFEANETRKFIPHSCNGKMLLMREVIDES